MWLMDSGLKNHGSIHLQQQLYQKHAEGAVNVSANSHSSQFWSTIGGEEDISISHVVNSSF